MINQVISKDSLMLGIFAILTTGLSVAVYSITEEKIELNKKIALEKALYELVPQDSHNNDMLADTVRVNDPRLGNDKAVFAYIARKQTQPIAAIIPVTAPEGYGGPINLLVGVYADGTLSGVRVVPPHKETPGLGDKIELKKSNWMLGFNGKSLLNPGEKSWFVKKDGGDFDSFTGATITPRAVVKAIHQTLTYYKENKALLFKLQQPALDSTSAPEHQTPSAPQRN